MRKHPKTLLAAIILAVSTFGCVDPGKNFADFDKRVIDAGMPAVGTGCMGGSIPDVTGEFYLALSTPLNIAATLERLPGDFPRSAVAHSPRVTATIASGTTVA